MHLSAILLNGLRDYGTEPQGWGGDPEWRGSLGLEPTPSLYVEHLVTVFREVRRVLRYDGTLWLNIGDSYSSGGRDSYGSFQPLSKQATHAAIKSAPRPPAPPSLKPKDLIGIPWMLAFALRQDGWYLRSEITWCKRAPMPESVTDRPTSATEKIFLFSKSARYFYDAEGVKEDATEGTDLGLLRGKSATTDSRVSWCAPSIRSRQNAGIDSRLAGNGKRNLRNWWLLSPEPFSAAHFATFPPEIPRRAITAGTSERGVCSQCGTPWSRIVDKSRRFESGSGRSGNLPEGKNGAQLQGGGQTLDIRRGPCVDSETIGWHANCQCNAPTIPATVLDPFAGAFTTCLVAERLQRNSIGIELNADYCEIGRKRLADDSSLFFAEATPTDAADDAQASLW